MSERGLALSLERPLRTGRLVLRGFEPADAEAIHAYRSLPEVARYVPFAPMDQALIAERLAGPWARRRATVEDGFLVVGIERLDTGELIGDLTLMLTSAEHCGGEIGWLLHPAHGGHGYATEAARAGLDLMFDAGVHRVTARVDARNTASLRLCERLGMRREAVLVENEWFKGEWSNEVDYALLDREWAGLSAR
ncbi:MAG TPA: GNAT family protein [Solirubrobacteraceae bacterium]|nr:GNAT family protein [Solirubrobacteraceae bacterium]